MQSSRRVAGGSEGKNILSRHQAWDLVNDEMQGRIRSIVLLPGNRNREVGIRKSGRNDGTDVMVTLHYSLKNAKGTFPSTLEVKNVGSGGLHSNLGSMTNQQYNPGQMIHPVCASPASSLRYGKII